MTVELLASPVAHSGETTTVSVKLTNTSAHQVVVGDCPSILGVYPAFLDPRTGRTLSGPGTLTCAAIGIIMPAGRSRTYTARARAFAGIPPKAHERPLPPGNYLLALRPFDESHAEFGLDRVPPLKVTVTA